MSRFLAVAVAALLVLGPAGVHAQSTGPSPAAKKAGKGTAKPGVSAPAEARYQEGLRHELNGDNRSALLAFVDAGNAGHGQAQRKLGDIYGSGNSAVKRDYDVALRWYEKARAQGVEIPKPHAFTRGR